MKKLTALGALRIIARECRENIVAYRNYPEGKKVKVGKGAIGEARGTVRTSREILATIRQLRKRT
jgi:hypothetical protein